MEEEKEPEPTTWTYTLYGGPHDGATGRFVKPRAQVHRPSHSDSRRVDVYFVEYVHGDTHQAVYRYGGQAWGALADVSDAI